MPNSAPFATVRFDKICLPARSTPSCLGYQAVGQIFRPPFLIAVSKMTDPTDPNALLLLGEIRGQLRELIHSSNNNAQKLDALSLRVGALEADKHRRAGAIGAFEWVSKFGPWLLSMALGVLAYAGWSNKGI